MSVKLPQNLVSLKQHKFSNWFHRIVGSSFYNVLWLFHYVYMSSTRKFNDNASAEKELKTLTQTDFGTRLAITSTTSEV